MFLNINFFYPRIKMKKVIITAQFSYKKNFYKKMSLKNSRKC